MAFDLEKEEAKYREERASRFANNSVNQESTVERDDGKTTQIIDESAGTPFSESFMWSAFFGGPIISYLAHLSNKTFKKVLFLGGLRYLSCSSCCCSGNKSSC